MFKLVLIPLLIGILTSCSVDIDRTDVPVSKVGNRTLYLSQVLSNLSDQQLKEDSTRAVDEYISAWEKRVILRNEAERLGLDQYPTIQNDLSDLQDLLLSDALLKMYLSELDTISISDTEWQEFFESNPIEIKVSEPSLRFYQFTSSTRDSLESYKNRILNNQASSLINELKARNPKWWYEQQLPVPIKNLEIDYANLRSFWRNAQNGQISDILPYNGSFQLFWIIQRLEIGSVLDTTSVRPYIEEWLITEKKNRKLKALEENLLVNARQNKLIQRPQINIQK